MKILRLILAGVVGGFLGGMGFGGGTLLIPILTFGIGLPQRLASWVNLVSFLPTALVSLIIHVKNKMVEKKKGLFLLLFALVGAIPCFFLSGKLPDRVIRVSFGWFLILLGVSSVITVLVGYFKKKEKQ